MPLGVFDGDLDNPFEKSMTQFQVVKGNRTQGTINYFPRGEMFQQRTQTGLINLVRRHLWHLTEIEDRFVPFKVKRFGISSDQRDLFDPYTKTTGCIQDVGDSAENFPDDFYIAFSQAK